jgi:hypothetical protein
MVFALIVAGATLGLQLLYVKLKQALSSPSKVDKVIDMLTDSPKITVNGSSVQVNWQATTNTEDWQYSVMVQTADKTFEEVPCEKDDLHDA